MPDLINTSVIIPTFNRKELVKRAIQSVLNQTLQPQEIIVIDDGSNDGTQSIVKNKYPQIKYFWQVNSGISSARNLGIRTSTGNWIAFLDSDDEWLPNKLEYQYTALSKYPEYKICHTNEIWIRKDKRVNPMDKHQKFGGYIFQKCLPLCVISPSSALINKQVFEQFGLFDTALPACEDYDMWLRVCAFLPVLYLEKPLLKKYGGHSDQLSQKYWGMDRFRIIALEKVVNNDFINQNDKKAALEMLLNKLNIFINGAINRGKNKSEFKEYVSKLEYYNRILLKQ
jgi:glycosyltransferase involved in cell wall biosynthesis